VGGVASEVVGQHVLHQLEGFVEETWPRRRLFALHLRVAVDEDVDVARMWSISSRPIDPVLEVGGEIAISSARSMIGLRAEDVAEEVAAEFGMQSVRMLLGVLDDAFAHAEG